MGAQRTTLTATFLSAALLLVSCSSQQNAPSCATAYSDLFQAKEIRILAIFGYKDARPARFVGDRYERAMFVRRILEDCHSDNQACGFVRSEDDGDLFTKVLETPDGGERQIELHVVNSSVGPDDDENRSRDYQRWQSAYAEKIFLRGVQRWSAVLYNGHSRDGGGPDFEPPRLKWGHTDYPWYRQEQPGLSKLVHALKEAPTHQLKLFGLYSCVSSKHFSSKIRSAKPSLSLVTSSKLLYYADALENMLATLSSILGMKCEGEFRRSIQAQSPMSQTVLEGFFRKLSHSDKN